MNDVLMLTKLLVFCAHLQHVIGMAEFRLPPSSPGSCSYYIRSEPRLNISFATSSQECERLNSNLAMIKNYTQQVEFDNLMLEVYNKNPDHLIFIGGEWGTGGKLRWMDNTLIPTTVGNHQYPRWIPNGPWKGATSPYKLVLTTFDTKTKTTKTTTTFVSKRKNKEKIVYFLEHRYNGRGYACEKLVSGKPCDSSPCGNNGKCIDVGCSYSCQCLRSYLGRNCGLPAIPMELKEATSPSNIFNNSFVLMCAVKGLPIPTVTWKVTNTKLNKIDESISNSANSLFSIKSYVTENVKSEIVESKLTVATGGLCLGRSEISCWASENTTSTGTRKLHSFKLNQHDYEAHEESYFVYSDGVAQSADAAREECRKLGGNLPDVPDESTQIFLARHINKRRANNTSWKSSGAWIGLRMNEQGVRFWPNQQTATYTNWAKGEPQDNLHCTYMSTSNTWKTQTCTIPGASNEFKAHYICQITGRAVPVILNVTSPHCESGNSSKITIRWRPSPKTRTKKNHVLYLTAPHGVSMTHRTSTDVANKNGEYVHTFDNLCPREKHRITVYGDSSYCAKPITSYRIQLTGYVTPGAVNAATLELRGNACVVAWTWPSSMEHTIETFIVNVTAYPNTTRIENYGEIAIPLKLKDSFLKVPPQNRSASIPAGRNRRHVIEVFIKSCAGSGTSTKAIGKCISPIAGPLYLSPPTLKKGSNSSIIISFSSAKEDNGPISCYFLVAQYVNRLAAEQESSPPTQELLESLQSFNGTSNGIPYLALAVKHDTQTQTNTFLLGDERQTSCDINGKLGTTSSAQNRSDMSIDTIYQARNYPLVPNKAYRFYIISSTPTLDGTIIFVESSKTDFNSTSGNKIWIVAGCGAAAIIAVMVGIGICIKRRRTQRKWDVAVTLSACNQNENLLASSVNASEPVTIPFENIDILDKLGEGHFSEVWKVRISNKPFPEVEAAAKIIKGSKLTVQQRKEFEMELKLMQRVGNNPFVIQLYGRSQDQDKIIAITELLVNGDLHQFLKRNRPSVKTDSEGYENPIPLGTNTMMRLSCDIATGMEHISSMNLVHRDLACRNVLLTDKLRCKISDFGLSREVTEAEGAYVKVNLVGAQLPSRWMSPEAYFEQIYTSASDVWSFGVVMWEIVAFGYTPYKKLNGRELQNKVLKENYRLQQPSYCPDEFYFLMQRCWNINSKYRPTFTDLKVELEGLCDCVANSTPAYEHLRKEKSIYEDINLKGIGFALN